MNSQNEFVVGNLIVTTPSEWLDVTEGIGSDETPFTLARNEGVGALQFSVGTYESGTVPDITMESLRTLLDDFAFSRELEKASMRSGMNPPRSLSAEVIELVTTPSEYGIAQMAKTWLW